MCDADQVWGHETLHTSVIVVHIRKPLAAQRRGATLWYAPMAEAKRSRTGRRNKDICLGGLSRSLRCAVATWDSQISGANNYVEAIQ